jgi:hypothetical protein
MEGSRKQLDYSNYLINNERALVTKTVSYFKHAYYQYANFVFDTRQLPLLQTARFDSANNFRIDMNKYGDLITNIMVQVELPDISEIQTTTANNIGYANGIGNILLEQVELRINGDLIDRQTSMFRNVWSSLTIKSGNRAAYNNLIKKFDEFTPTKFTGGTVFIPLLFWFCHYTNEKDKSLVLPISAFYNQTIELNLKFAPFSRCYVSYDNSIAVPPVGGFPQIKSAQLLIDYVTLTETERMQLISPSPSPSPTPTQSPLLLRTSHAFATASSKAAADTPVQSWLIAQTGMISYDIDADTTAGAYSLKSINYLVSEIIVIVQRKDVASAPLNDYFNYSDKIGLTNRQSLIERMTLKFDGSDKYRDMPAQFFYNVVPLKYHSNTEMDNFMHCITFSLEPEKWEQPDGVCNFSEIHEPSLSIEFTASMPAATLTIMYINYNMLLNSRGCVSLLHSLSRAIPTALIQY